MKILKIKINGKVSEERILKQKDGVIKTKHHELVFRDGFFESKEEGFEGACVITRGAVRNMFKKIGI